MIFYSMSVALLRLIGHSVELLAAGISGNDTLSDNQFLAGTHAATSSFLQG